MSDDKTTRRFRQDTLDRIEKVQSALGGLSLLRVVDAFTVAWLELEAKDTDRLAQAISDAPIPTGQAAGRALWDSTCDRLDQIAQRTKITVHANLVEVLLAAWLLLTPDEQRTAIAQSGQTAATT